MHCKTEQEAKEFCEEMHKAGKKWKSGASYLERTNWRTHEDQTCYFFNEGEFCGINWYSNNSYKILKWSDFSAPSNSIHIYTDGTTTTAILKDGKNVVKKAQAKCSPDDTYDFAIGAKLAFDRLMGVEGVREVKRKAKVGEWVKVTGTEGHSLNKNSIAKVNMVYSDGWVEVVVCSKYDVLRSDEYVVLENYKPEIEDKPLEVIINGEKYIKEA